MKRLLVIIPLLLSGLALSACEPPTCGQDHRGWVEATAPGGARASVYMEWTSMGWGPHCVGKWTGNPRPYPDVPFTGCTNGAIGGTASGDGSGSVVWMKTRCNNSSVFEVQVTNFKQGAQMYSRCQLLSGPGPITCRANHVTYG